MLKLWILLVFLSTCYGTFFLSSQNNEAYNICVYSKDPSQYDPKCFICPREVYQNAMLACLNGTTSMPSNITYASAKCIEKNCAINYPKPATNPPFDISFLQKMSELFLRQRRSTDDNKVQESSAETVLDPSDFNILGRIETFASDFAPETTEFTELDIHTF